MAAVRILKDRGTRVRPRLLDPRRYAGGDCLVCSPDKRSEIRGGLARGTAFPGCRFAHPGSEKKLSPPPKPPLHCPASLLAQGRCHDAIRKPGRGRAADNAACPFRRLRTLACGVERREAQRFGGGASQALRSPPARASGWVSQTRPCKARWGVRHNAPAPRLGAVAQRPGASRRSIFSPGRVCPHPDERAAERWLLAAPRATRSHEFSLPNVRCVLRLFARLAALRARNRGRDLGDPARAGRRRARHDALRGRPLRRARRRDRRRDRVHDLRGAAGSVPRLSAGRRFVHARAAALRDHAG